MNLEQRIRQAVQHQTESWTALRRQLHRHPELGWLEFATTDALAGALERAGLRPVLGPSLHVADQRQGLPGDEQMARAFQAACEQTGRSPRLDLMRGGYTGAVVEITGERPGPLRAFRCDIDALPILESASGEHAPARQDFASKIPGAMHACGHDAHAVIGVGLAEVLHALRQDLAGTVRVIFQPAEEGTRGAVSMVAAGLAEGVCELYGLHVGVNARRTGELVCSWGGLMATAKLDVNFHGRQAHAALAPEQGRDALAAAALATVRLKELGRRLGPECRLHVGELFGGEGRNIIAARATLRMESRASRNDLHADVRAQAEAVLALAADEFGTTCQVRVVGSAPAWSADPQAARAVQHAAEGMAAFPEVRLTDDNFAASDDASVWMTHVRRAGGQAAFIGLGTPTGGGHHTPTFDIDESRLAAGVELLARLYLLPR